MIINKKLLCGGGSCRPAALLKGDFFVLFEKYAEKYCGKTVYIPADIVDVRGERGRDVIFFYHLQGDD